MSTNSPFGIQRPATPQRVSTRLLEHCADRLRQAFTQLRASLPDAGFKPFWRRDKAAVTVHPSPERGLSLKERVAKVATAWSTGAGNEGPDSKRSSRSHSTPSVDLSRTSQASASATPIPAEPKPADVDQALGTVKAYFDATPVSVADAGHMIFRANSDATRAIKDVIQSHCGKRFQALLDGVVASTLQGAPANRGAVELRLTQTLVEQLSREGSRIEDLVPEPAHRFLQGVVDQTAQWDGVHGSAQHVVAGSVVLRGLASTATVHGATLAVPGADPQQRLRGDLYLSLGRLLNALAVGSAPYAPPPSAGATAEQRQQLAALVEGARPAFRAGLQAIASPGAGLGVVAS